MITALSYELGEAGYNTAASEKLKVTSLWIWIFFRSMEGTSIRRRRVRSNGFTER